MHITVAIPTRNRPKLALRAISSILSQCKPDEDLTILVSDNSDPEYKIQFRESVTRLNSKLIKVISPPKALSHVDHWQWIALQSEGDYLGYLTDRMAWRSGSLEKLKETLWLYRPTSLSYTGFGAISRRNSLWLSTAPFTGRVFEYTRREVAANAARMKFYFNLPYMLNSFISTGKLHELFSAYKCPFGTIVGDVGFASCAMDAIETGHYWDYPLYIAGDAASGIGQGLTTGLTNPALEDFVAGVQKKGGLSQAPIPEIISNMNLRAHEYMQVFNSQKSGDLKPIDYQCYYNRLMEECSIQKHSFPENAKSLLEAFRVRFSLNRSHRNISVWNRSVRTLKEALNQSPLPILFKILGATYPGVLSGPFRTLEDILKFDLRHPASARSRGGRNRYW